METLAFLLLTGTALGVFLTTLARRGGYLELPFLFSAVYLGWVIAQLYQVRRFTRDEALESLISLHMMSWLCLVAVVAGWRAGCRAGRQPLRETPMLRGDIAVPLTTAMTVIAWGCTLALGFVDTNTRGTVNWSGPATIIAFVGSVGVLSLFLSSMMVFTRQTPVTLALFAANVLLYLTPVLIHFRRAGTVELMTCLALALWLARRWVAPRWAVAAAIPAGMMFVFAVGALRGLSATGGVPTLAELSTVDFWGATPFGAGDASTSSEMRNALAFVRLANEFGWFTFGAESWNTFVFQWVPGQIVGHEIKAALMFDTALGERVQVAMAHTMGVGVTYTGLGQAYLDFWYFGCVPFFLMAWIMGRWWVQANRGSLQAATLYAAGLSPALHAVTHYTVYFFNNMLLLWLATVLVAWGLRLMAADRSVRVPVRAFGPRLRAVADRMESFDRQKLLAFQRGGRFLRAERGAKCPRTTPPR